MFSTLPAGKAQRASQNASQVSWESARRDQSVSRNACNASTAATAACCAVVGVKASRSLERDAQGSLAMVVFQNCLAERAGFEPAGGY